MDAFTHLPPIRVKVSDKRKMEAEAAKSGLTLAAWIRAQCGLTKYVRAKQKRKANGKR